MNINASKIKLYAAAVACLSTVLSPLGCDTNERQDESSDEGSDDPCEDSVTKIVIDRSHNYSFLGAVSIKEYKIQEYPNDPLIDWSSLTKDIKGHDVDPKTDIGHVEIIVWNLDNYDTFEGWLNTDSIEMEYFGSMVNLDASYFEDQKTEAYLSEFTSGGKDADAETYFRASEGQFPSDEYIFVLVAGRGSSIGYDAVSAAFLKPVQSDTAETGITLDDESVSLTYEVSLNSNSYRVPRDTGDTVLDWTDMLGEENAVGEEFTPNHAGLVMLTFYRGLDLSELQENFLDLEIIADKKYSTEPPDPTPITLSDLTDEDGNAFSDFGEEEGTWLLSLWCTSGCNNPAPKYLTSLSPCP